MTTVLLPAMTIAMVIHPIYNSLVPEVIHAQPAPACSTSTSAELPVMPGTTVPARGPLYVRVNEVGQLESSYHIGQEEGRKIRLTIPLITSNTSRPLKCNLVFGSVYLAGRPVISQYFLAGSSDGGAWDVRSEVSVMHKGEGG